MHIRYAITQQEMKENKEWAIQLLTDFAKDLEASGYPLFTNLYVSDFGGSVYLTIEGDASDYDESKVLIRMSDHENLTNRPGYNAPDFNLDSAAEEPIGYVGDTWSDYVPDVDDVLYLLEQRRNDDTNLKAR